MSKLSKNILATVIYYDIMDYALTAFEIWKYLIVNNINDEQQVKNNSCLLADVLKELETEKMKKNIEEYGGFYFFRGRKELVKKRIKSNKISENKFKKAKKIVHWLKFLPFVRMIAVAGRVSTKNARNESDIDLFIILKHGHIFTGRFFITMLIHILGKRRYGRKIKNRICLNHFVSDKYFVSIRDLYSSHAYSFLMPVYKPAILEAFKEKNNWIKNYRPDIENTSSDLKEVGENWFSICIKKCLEKMFRKNWIEKIMKRTQIKKIEKNPATFKKGGVIIYSDCELAFWPDFENQGPDFFKKFYDKLRELDDGELVIN